MHPGHIRWVITIAPEISIVEWGGNIHGGNLQNHAAGPSGPPMTKTFGIVYRSRSGVHLPMYDYIGREDIACRGEPGDKVQHRRE